MKKIPKEDRAGLYITIIVHLVVLIVLLVASLSGEISKENSFILDFSQLERQEKLQKELSLKEAISRKLDALLAEGGSVDVKNVSVNNSSKLKDDRGTDAEQLYKDAKNLQERLDKGFSVKEDIRDEVQSGEKEKEQESAYSGPSVLCWEMSGRKASRLPIPAYRCLGAGEVKVFVVIDPAGSVLSAEIDESSSSSDSCLRSFAVKAAKLSRFSACATAQPKQKGWIIYQFIAQ